MQRAATSAIDGPSLHPRWRRSCGSPRLIPLVHDSPAALARLRFRVAGSRTVWSARWAPRATSVEICVPRPILSLSMSDDKLSLAPTRTPVAVDAELTPFRPFRHRSRAIRDSRGTAVLQRNHRFGVQINVRSRPRGRHGDAESSSGPGSLIRVVTAAAHNAPFGPARAGRHPSLGYGRRGGALGCRGTSSWRTPARGRCRTCDLHRSAPVPATDLD